MKTDEQLLQEFIEENYSPESIKLLSESDVEQIRQSKAFSEYKNIYDIEWLLEDIVPVPADCYSVGVWSEDEQKLVPVSSHDELSKGLLFFDSSEELTYKQATERMERFQNLYPNFRFEIFKK